MASKAASGDLSLRTTGQLRVADQSQQSCFSARNLLITGLAVSILVAGMGVVAMQLSWVGTTGSIAWIATGGTLALAFSVALVCSLCKKCDSSLQLQPQQTHVPTAEGGATTTTIEEHPSHGNFACISEKAYKQLDLTQFSRTDIEDLFRNNDAGQQSERMKWSSLEQVRVILESGYEGAALRYLALAQNKHKIPADVRLTEGQRFQLGKLSFAEIQSRPHLWHLVNFSDFDRLDWTSEDSYFQKLDKNAQHALLDEQFKQDKIRACSRTQLNAALATGWAGGTLNHVAQPSYIGKLTAAQFEAFCRERPADARGNVRSSAEEVRHLQPQVLYDLLVEQKYDGWALKCISEETLQKMMLDERYANLKSQITDKARKQLFPED